MNDLATDEHLERYLSEAGIRSWTNHIDTDDGDVELDAEANAAVLNDCKVYVNGFLSGRLIRRYEWASLEQSPMMAEVWCVCVLRTLCVRRGNPIPASIESRYQEIIQKDGLIDQILAGQMFLTDVNGNPLAPRNSNAPSWSNLTIDRWFPESKQRVVTGSSDMSPSDLTRRVDRFPERFG
jgi:hypothetical protein